MDKRTQQILDMSEAELRAVLMFLSDRHPADFADVAARVLDRTRKAAS